MTHRQRIHLRIEAVWSFFMCFSSRGPDVASLRRRASSATRRGHPARSRFVAINYSKPMLEPERVKRSLVTTVTALTTRFECVSFHASGDSARQHSQDITKNSIYFTPNITSSTIPICVSPFPPNLKSPEPTRSHPPSSAS